VTAFARVQPVSHIAFLNITQPSIISKDRKVSLPHQFLQCSLLAFSIFSGTRHILP